MTAAASQVTAIIPVKPWGLSKSRLDVGDDAARVDLARAFALDVIDVVSGSTRVGKAVVVTAEAELGAVAARIGAVLLPDRPMLFPDALDRAVDAGRRWAMARRPQSPVVVVPADLPALTISTFDQTLRFLRAYSLAFVPDAVGRGTTLTWARKPQDLRTSYGLASATMHSRAGFHPLADVDPRVRLDVDTSADLAEARLLGLGRHSAHTVNELSAMRVSSAR